MSEIIKEATPELDWMERFQRYGVGLILNAVVIIGVSWSAYQIIPAHVAHVQALDAHLQRVDKTMEEHARGLQNVHHSIAKIAERIDKK